MTYKQSASGKQEKEAKITANKESCYMLNKAFHYFIFLLESDSTFCFCFAVSISFVRLNREYLDYDKWSSDAQFAVMAC